MNIRKEKKFIRYKFVFKLDDDFRRYQILKDVSRTRSRGFQNLMTSKFRQKSYSYYESFKRQKKEIIFRSFSRQNDGKCF